MNPDSPQPRAEDALRESEARFRSLAESTAAAIFTIQGSTIFYANPAAEALTGYRLNEMAEMPFWDLVHPDERERSRLRGMGRQRAQSVPSRCEIRILTKAGEERIVDYCASVFEHAGAPAIVGTAIDITDRKRAEEGRRELEAQVQHRQKLESLGLLAGGIAHDFNNLLTGILGTASLLALRFPAGSSESEQLQRVLIAAERAAELTSQMLAYAGKGQPVLGPADINQLVEEVAPLVKTSLGRRASIQLELAPNLPEIEADRTQLQQVVVSLLANAAEAQAGRIVARTGAMTAMSRELGSRPSVFLEVRDDGSGMDDDTKARMFDPFFTTKFTGRGFGLAAVQGIVSAHGGTIRVESAPGRGTIVTVLLPALIPMPGADPIESDRAGA